MPMWKRPVVSIIVLFVFWFSFVHWATTRILSNVTIYNKYSSQSNGIILPDILHRNQLQRNSNCNSTQGNSTLCLSNKNGYIDDVNTVKSKQLDIYSLSRIFELHVQGPKVPGYHILNTQICTQMPHLRFLVYFHTAPSNFETRQFHRALWANKEFFQDGRMAAVFFLGMSTNETEQLMIKTEAEIHKDIVQGDFIDSYRNLTYKGLLAIKWISEHCTHAQFIVKLDDDAFFNVFRITSFLDVLGNQSKSLICAVLSTSIILRDKKICNKWCMSSGDLPSLDTYPTYCSGMMYIFTGDMIVPMLNAVRNTPFLWVDDVYITGMLPRFIPDFKYINIINEVQLFKELGHDLMKYIVYHTDNLDGIYNYWAIILLTVPMTFVKETSLNFTGVRHVDGSYYPDFMANPQKSPHGQGVAKFFRDFSFRSKNVSQANL